MLLTLAFGMPGTQELIIIAIIILVLFGATKLPKLGSSIGEGIRNFKRGMREVEAEDEAAKKKKALESDEKKASEEEEKKIADAELKTQTEEKAESSKSADSDKVA